MNKITNRGYLAFLAIVTALTAILAFATPSINNGSTKSIAHAQNTIMEEVTAFKFEPMWLNMENISFATTNVEPEVVEPVVEQTEEPVETIAPEIVEVTPQYKVTAYYLNVRESNSKESKIIDVLEKDNVVELANDGETWVELTTGGFVHKSYLELIPAPDQPIVGEAAAEVTAQVEVTKVDASVKNSSTEVSTLSYSTNKSNVTIVDDITSKSNLTLEDLQAMLEGTAMEGIEEAVLEVEELYNINALFTIAVARLESGHGTSKIARKKNNLFGLNAIDGDAYNKAFSYETKSDSVLAFGKIMSKNYIEKGYDTLAKINKKYSTSSSWKTKVRSLIKREVNNLENKVYL